MLLDDIAAYIKRFVILPDEALTACTLWVAHTHTIEASFITPYLHLRSAEAESGKTTLFDVLGRLAARPWSTAYASAAAVRRGLDTNPPPTLLVDEVETIFAKGGDDFLRGVLNAGFRRGGEATVLVKKGQDWELKAFNVFGPKLMAGIGLLPNTVESRSIPIEMRRKRRDEPIERARERDLADGASPLKTQLEEWAVENVEALKDARPEIPALLSSRQSDFWEPLLAIADLFGGTWPDKARAASLCLHAPKAEDSQGVQLLRDIRDIFIEEGKDAMYSFQLVELLVLDETKIWYHLNGGRDSLDPAHLALLLKPFGVTAVRLRLYINDSKQARGYKKEMFQDAWERYL